MRARFIPFAVIVVLTVAACDSGPSGRGPSGSVPATGSTVISHSVPPHPASPTVPADVPTTGPNLLRAGEKPPVMPLEATQHTAAGALAFAKFFIQTIDWGFATTSGAYMRHYFESTCAECRSHADGLDNTRNAGDHYLGGRFTIQTATQAAIGSKQGERSIDVTFDLSSVEVLDDHGQFVNGDIAKRNLSDQVWLIWRSTGWRVVDSAPV